MSEINGPKFSVNQVNFQGIQKNSTEIPQEIIENDTPQLKDFSNPAEYLGRSQVKYSNVNFKGTDNTENDLKILMENPEIAKNSDKIFETAFKAMQDAGIENPYEEATEIATGNV